LLVNGLVPIGGQPSGQRETGRAVLVLIPIYLDFFFDESKGIESVIDIDDALP
jgi:hypothetical protein